MTDAIHNYGYRTPRFQVDFRLMLQTDDRLPQLLDAHCSDLSEDGLAAEINESLEIGARVILIFSLPGGSTSIKIAAKVINRQGDGYGFAFIFSSPNERDYISDYLEALRPDPGRSPESPT